jgi:hypothetical protein
MQPRPFPRPVRPPAPCQVCRTPGISCEVVPASDLAGAGMRRHVHAGNHAAESFVSFIPLFDRLAICRPRRSYFSLWRARP